MGDDEGMNRNDHSGAEFVVCVGAPQQDEELYCTLGKRKLESCSFGLATAVAVARWRMLK